MKLLYPRASGLYIQEIDMSKLLIKEEHGETPLDIYIHGVHHTLKALEDRIYELERKVGLEPKVEL